MILFVVSVISFLPGICFAIFLGPYSGRVIDSQTGEVVDGASVLVFWVKQVPTPLRSHSEVMDAKLVYTDKNGTYRIPQILPNLGLMAMLESTCVIIYQPGYQAYTVSIWHDHPSAKAISSFKERENVVKLDRIPPNFNHREHIQTLRNALNSIRAYGSEDPVWGKPLTWKKRMELNLKSGVLEKEELLRRAAWEEKRNDLR
jgi:hypothetical protein